MRKTMVYLEEGQHAQLANLARRRKSSVAALIRAAVAGLLSEEAPEPRLSFVGMGEGPRQDDVSTRPHEAVRRIVTDRVSGSER